MKPTTEQLEAYKAMAIAKAVPSMEEQIKANLEATCDKYKGNEDKFEGCIKYLKETALEILGGVDAAEEDGSDGIEKRLNGEVPDEVCFRICRDYFNDEIWLKEETEKKEEEEKIKETVLDTETAPIRIVEPEKDEIKPEHGQMSFLDTLGV